MPQSRPRPDDTPGPPGERYREDTGPARFINAHRAVYEALAHYHATQELRECAFERAFQHAARRSMAVAPPTFTAGVRDSLANLPIAPATDDDPFTRPASRYGLTARGRRLMRAPRRTAAGGVSALGVVLMLAVGMAVDPGDASILLGSVLAFGLTALAVVHAISAALGALMGSAILATVAFAVYAGMAVLWVRLVRRPVEV
ncbi:MAG TPA: hypothetical protein VF818_02285 [Ktedonobacterales bacterium]